MTMPVGWKHDRHDQVHDEPFCQMTVVDNDYDDDTIADLRECGSELYLNWSFSVPVSCDEHIEERNVPDYAVTSRWELVCTEGHVLATSANTRNTRDGAETFVPVLVIPRGRQ